MSLSGVLAVNSPNAELKHLVIDSIGFIIDKASVFGIDLESIEDHRTGAFLKVVKKVSIKSTIFPEVSDEFFLEVQDYLLDFKEEVKSVVINSDDIGLDYVNKIVNEIDRRVRLIGDYYNNYMDEEGGEGIYESSEILHAVMPAVKKYIAKKEEREKLKFNRLDEMLDFLNSSEDQPASIKWLFNEAQKAYQEVEQCKSDIKEQVSSVEEKGIEATLRLEAEAKDALSRTKEELDKFLSKKTELLQQIESIAEKAARRGVVASHKETAASEKSTANWLRAGALALMLLSVGILATSLYEFDPKDHIQTAYRIIISLLITVPAAYLARESAKHRQQQYRYHEIALNVNAVNPLIKDLEKADQDKIRAQLASDLLAANTSGNSASAQQVADPFPISVNDVVLKILDKVDLKPGASDKSTAKAESTTSQSQVTKTEASAQEAAAAQPAEPATEKPQGEQKNATPA